MEGGNFKKIEGFLPKITTKRIGCYSWRLIEDGDLRLFVGSRVYSQWDYGLRAKAFLLELNQDVKVFI